MPKRNDIHKICIIGAGPIIIGQACEFDYSGTQACKALKEEGYEIVLINSNPATIMTDPETAHRTYIEPITPEYVASILRKERPDALLPTLGGQTALNTAFQVAEMGVLEECGIEMIGANRDVIHRAEDRDAFRETMRKAGINLPKSELARTLDEAMQAVKIVGLPCVIRPAFTLGGTGGGIVHDFDEFRRVAERGIDVSLVHEILIEESLEGWKEFEMEVMRDKNDNVVIVCSIENFDPMGIHTGDSITVAPIQTLTDREYQYMRDMSIAIIRAIGVESGGCNIQFAQNPTTGRFVVIEMNPRVSRSSALASKATGFPIAKIAAKVAVGYTLDEIPNDITRKTLACFEPALDYCVVKIPRFAFEKFPGGNESLTIQMKSVGEIMSIGRSFKEALHKGIRSLETKQFSLFQTTIRSDFYSDNLGEVRKNERETLKQLTDGTANRLFLIADAMRNGVTLAELHKVTHIDPWFLKQIEELVIEGNHLQNATMESYDYDSVFHLKRLGFSDRRLGELFGKTETEFRAFRKELGVKPVYYQVDTCAGEFEAAAPYYYSTYEKESENEKATADTNSCPSVLILGSGPNRIGQGIEFDFCCSHASFAVREMGYRSIMMNCNPETVSTDYDTSDKLYFEPLTLEDVLGVVDHERPMGVIVQFGGQTPLNIAQRLAEAGVPILGTSIDSIALAEDRKRFSEMLKRLQVRQPVGETSVELNDAIQKAEKIGYPVLMRPSFVLGGAKMEIVFDSHDLKDYWKSLLVYCTKADVTIDEEHPILIDDFLNNAVEVDVDALCDGKRVCIAGVMEHIEEAGIHSGDSACSLPSRTIPQTILDELKSITKKIALEMKVVGLLNIQFAIRDEMVYVLEVNPRASRTIPFVSKVAGIPVAKYATKILLGETLDSLEFPDELVVAEHVGVKESVFPWMRFPGIDVRLGPEMKSTGEAMGIGTTFPAAFVKSQLAVGTKIPISGNVFLSVKDSDKPLIGDIAKQLTEFGFSIIATGGTADVLQQQGFSVQRIRKIIEGIHPNILDRMNSGEIDWIINTPSGKNPHRDEVSMRCESVRLGIPLVTTIRGTKAYLEAIAFLRDNESFEIGTLQEYHNRLKK